MYFELKIKLGNDAMCETGHLVQALRDIANQIERRDYVNRLVDKPGDLTRFVFDENGNSVGNWKLNSED